MKTENAKGKFYTTKSKAIKEWLDLALQDSKKGLEIAPEEILSNPMLAISIANKVSNGKKPYGFNFRNVNVSAVIKSSGMACNAINPHLILRWGSKWTEGRYIQWDISLDDQDNSCIAYFDTGTGTPSKFIGRISKGEDVPLDKNDK